MQPNDLELVRAEPAALYELLPLVSAFHAEDGITLAAAQREQAVSQLLANPQLGEIWQIASSQRLVGYAAVCFGYSIEFGGRDAFIDELFIERDARGRGIGTWVMDRLATDLSSRGVRALHLEVNRQNARARALYAKAGYQNRSNFHLMTRIL